MKRMGRLVVATACLCAVAAPAVPAAAQSSQQFRLESTAFGGVQPGMALLVLHGTEDVDGWLSADALVWGGLKSHFALADVPKDDLTADVLVMSINLRDPEGRAEGRIGRFVVGPGALRPVHVDGADATVRIPGDLRFELFAGQPVVPEFGDRNYDWLVGGRLSRAIGDWGSVGLAYLHQRDHGVRSDSEIGVDAGAAITDWWDANGKVSVDLLNPGISEILGLLSFHQNEWKTDVFYKERQPSRILPATSLFSVLSDVASRDAGARIDYRVAPRLDVDGTLAMRWIGNDIGELLRLAATLRLDDEGRGALSGEARRESAPDATWTGLRGAARVPIIDGLTASAEVELVIPDHPQGRGKVWPWGLVGVEWKPVEQWEVAAAVLASSSPEFQHRTDALVRVTHHLGVP